MSDNPSMNGFDCSQLIKDFEALPDNMGISEYWRSELDDRDKQVQTLKGLVYRLQQQLLREMKERNDLIDTITKMCK